jgi:hypothetical protein
MGLTEITAEGLGEVLAAAKAVDSEFAHELAEGLRASGKVVERIGARRFERYSEKSAAGFKTYVRAGARVLVEQSLRKTTGERPDYGALQMRKALLPALSGSEDVIEQTLDFRVARLLRQHGF